LLNKNVLVLFNSKSSVYGFRAELLSRLNQEGFNLIVSAPESQKETKDRSNLEFKFLPTLVERRGLNPLKDLKLLFSYRKYLKRYKPFVVLSYTVKPNIYGGLACRISKVPHIANITGLGTSIQNKGILQRLVLWLTKKGLYQTRKVFFQNTSNRDFYAEKAIVRPDQTVLIPGSGVNLERHPFEPYVEESEKTTRLLFIGRMMKDKGLNELLEALVVVRTKNPNVICDLVGPYEEHSFEPLIERYESEGYGKYLGVSDDVHNLIKQYHAVVLPSYHEGMANVLLEAAACGRPVLASNVPGCRETFDEGVSGLGFEAKSVDSLVSVIERFITLPYEKKVAMGLAGRKKMEQEFDRQIVVEAYMKEIKVILSDKEGVHHD
jgi:galacturonosyltransferase